MNCDYCKTNPGTKNNSIVWNGFLDADTNQYVCFPCKTTHYQEKQKTKFKGLVSEYPVTVKEKLENQTQLNL